MPSHLVLIVTLWPYSLLFLADKHVRNSHCALNENDSPTLQCSAEAVILNLCAESHSFLHTVQTIPREIHQPHAFCPVRIPVLFGGSEPLASPLRA